MQSISLIIGHSATSKGASNKTSGVSEFDFNEPLALSVAEKLRLEGFQVFVIYRDCSYSELPAKVNDTKADIAVSLHCNAFNSHANGTETLYYRGSSKGSQLARAIQVQIVSCLGLADRGVKPCVASHKGKAGDRGGHLLKYTSMPCVIVEPFFIDCDSSLQLANEKFESLTEAYCKGISNFLRC